MNADYIARYEQVAGYTLRGFGEYSRDDKAQTATDKAKSKEHGEVFTPLWLVDEMVKASIEYLDIDSLGDTVTSDCCAGYGAFTIRMAQQMPEHKVEEWLQYYHLMTEYQISSVLRLIYIFGTDINLIQGDSNKAYDYMKSKKTLHTGILFDTVDGYKTFKWTIKKFFSTTNEHNLDKNIELYTKMLENKIMLIKEINKEDAD